MCVTAGSNHDSRLAPRWALSYVFKISEVSSALLHRHIASDGTGDGWQTGLSNLTSRPQPLSTHRQTTAGIPEGLRMTQGAKHKTNQHLHRISVVALAPVSFGGTAECPGRLSPSFAASLFIDLLSLHSSVSKGLATRQVSAS